MSAAVLVPSLGAGLQGLGLGATADVESGLVLIERDRAVDRQIAGDHDQIDIVLVVLASQGIDGVQEVPVDREIAVEEQHAVIVGRLSFALERGGQRAAQTGVGVGIGQGCGGGG
ncbi:hypothetical protein [Actinomadura litoris]|uniref:hypothetical protein n=1 Tax=Actinomadura litoris TaxID=2678616 RepID=UPI001C12A44F